MITFPVWLSAVLAVGSAVCMFEVAQPIVQTNPTAVLVLGTVNVAITALLAFQRGAVATVRRLRGKPGLPPR